MNTTSKKGLLTEIECEKDFSKLGVLLSKPITPDSRYDYLADVNGKILKIQCKTANPKDDACTAITIPCMSRNWNSGKRHNYVGQIDFFYTFWEGQGYLIPIDIAKGRVVTIRFSRKYETENQINWADDYTIENILLERYGYKDPQEDNGQERKKYQCQICGEEISRGATQCVRCAHLPQRFSSINVSRDELKSLIRSMPFVEIGKMFGITDNAVRKYCDKLDLPRHKREIERLSDEEWVKI